MKDKAKFSQAKVAFDRNWDNLHNLLDMMLSAGQNISNMIDLLQSNVPQGKEEFDKRLNEVKETNRKQNSVTQFLFQWQAVMMVTFTETYLQDVLSEAARFDQDLIKNSKLSAAYDEIISFSSIDELALELRRRWASRNFVDSGPIKWIERFRQMGSHELDTKLANSLEQLWGIRHLVVHNAGIVTTEFTRIHKELGHTVGSQIKLTGEQLSSYAKPVLEFVYTTDSYLLQRFPQLALKS